MSTPLFFIIIIIGAVSLGASQLIVQSVPPPTCPSRIYCQGELLHVVQMSSIFNDSKHFVDMTMLRDEEQILSDFEDFMVENNRNPPPDKVREFVLGNFELSEELEQWTPKDYNPNPAFLGRIKNEKVKSFAQHLVNVWPDLGRRINPAVLSNISRHSLLPLGQGFVVPGGRFRETYYWDTYWIVKGLLLSEMPDTVRGMLDNFVTLIKKYGFIPNGARLYYTGRSQPPLFAPMVKAYIDATGDRKWLKRNLRWVEAELKFWLENRFVTVRINGTGNAYKMARYLPETQGPRPESYKEDYETASVFPDEPQRQRVYVDLKGGAESGWDFSTRWIYDERGSSDANISSIYTRRTIPVDLNSFLYRAFDAYADLAFNLGRANSGRFWFNEAIKLRAAIKDVLWNDDAGLWFDYDLIGRRHRKDFFVSNLTPLWCGAQHAAFRADRLLAYLNALRIFDFPGGTPSSLQQSGEQWDYPNAWPPLQAIIVQSLAKCGDSLEAMAQGKRLAETWVQAMMRGFDETGFMFEKYNALEAGKRGGGGEYEVQAGFGWTNGVALEFINQYFTTTTAG